MNRKAKNSTTNIYRFQTNVNRLSKISWKIKIYFIAVYELPAKTGWPVICYKWPKFAFYSRFVSLKCILAPNSCKAPSFWLPYMQLCNDCNMTCNRSIGFRITCKDRRNKWQSHSMVYHEHAGHFRSNLDCITFLKISKSLNTPNIMQSRFENFFHYYITMLCSRSYSKTTIKENF